MQLKGRSNNNKNKINMEVKKIEKLNRSKLKKRYHEALTEIPDNEINGVIRAWKIGDNKMLWDITNQYQGDKYYILAIWLHPLTKFQQLADKVDTLRKSLAISS